MAYAVLQEKKFWGQKWRKFFEKYTFLSISLQPVHSFSDFWYKTSLINYFEYGIGISARKKNWAKNDEKGVKNMHFRALLDNLPLDLSDFWYETSRQNI